MVGGGPLGRAGGRGDQAEQQQRADGLGALGRYHREQDEKPDPGARRVAVTDMAASPRMADAPVWSDHVQVVLARAGLKRGGARQRVIELLAREPCALSAVEIEDALRPR